MSTRVTRDIRADMEGSKTIRTITRMREHLNKGIKKTITKETIKMVTKGIVLVTRTMGITIGEAVTGNPIKQDIDNQIIIRGMIATNKDRSLTASLIPISMLVIPMQKIKIIRGSLMAVHSQIEIAEMTALRIEEPIISATKTAIITQGMERDQTKHFKIETISLSILKGLIIIVTNNKATIFLKNENMVAITSKTEEIADPITTLTEIETTIWPTIKGNNQDVLSQLSRLNFKL